VKQPTDCVECKAIKARLYNLEIWKGEQHADMDKMWNKINAKLSIKVSLTCVVVLFGFMMTAWGMHWTTLKEVSKELREVNDKLIEYTADNTRPHIAFESYEKE